MNKLTPGGAAWGGGGGSEIINQTLHQTSPRLVDDGSGGCYLVWVHSSTPASIWGARVNAFGSVQWGSGAGIQIFSGSSSSADASRNPRISRDGSQLCVAGRPRQGDRVRPRARPRPDLGTRAVARRAASRTAECDRGCADA